MNDDSSSATQYGVYGQGNEYGVYGETNTGDYGILGDGTTAVVEMAVASGLFVGHQRTRPPYIGWPDHVIVAVREFLQEKYPELIAPAFD